MDNNKPKVQNMNDFVNGSIEDTKANIPVSAPKKTENTSSQVSNSSAERQTRSQHVATGMRSASRASEGNRQSAMQQTVVIGGQGSAKKSSQSQQPRKSSSQQARKASSENAYREESSGAMRKNETGSRRYSDIRDEKRAKQASSAKSGGKKPKNGKKMSRYKKFLIIFSGALLAILIIGSIIFAAFLKSFEDGQHSHIAENIVENYSSSSKLKKYLNDNKSDINCLEDFDTLVDSYVASVDGKNITYVYDTSSTSETPAYFITADGAKVARVTMERDGDGAFGLQRWKVGKLDITSYVPGTKSFDIMVPEGSSVTVNGTELDRSYITNEGIPVALQNSVQFIKEAPNYVTYTVSGFTKTPEVTAVDELGSSLKLSSTESTFMAGPETSAAFVEEVKPLVERGLESWSTYFIYMSHNLDLYILKECELYKYIFGGDGYDPINPWLYNWEQIVDYYYTEFEVSNIVRYTDDCFTCDVKYHLDITFSEAGMKDDNQELDATWVWVTDNGSWSISDIIYH